MGSQFVPAPNQWSFDGQSACVVTVHAPVFGSQQAPVGCGHGFGSQVVPGPCQVFGGAQLACVVTVHWPVVGLQQAPVGCGHGFGLHDGPPFQVLGGRH